MPAPIGRQEHASLWELSMHFVTTALACLELPAAYTSSARADRLLRSSKG